MNTTPANDSGTANGKRKPADFSKVWDEECRLLACERGGGATADDVRKTACGLAFSGGGIRSATFNLGIIQALSENKLLQRFDYLSTVSGGGYIGSWLSTLLYRQARGNAAEMEKLIAPPPPTTGGRAQSGPKQVSGTGAI
ncbi:MAG TPA: patatin-like phospholipase family protein, partial [Burkholderiales bacterium]|nr:patatin-like phospholipase family protein [Burkholderiales bacterium]